jgi:hypothetical protein
MKKIFSILILSVAAVLLFTAQNFNPGPRWNLDPRMTAVPQGGYVPLPDILSNNYQQNTQSRVVNTTIGNFLVGPSFRVHPSTTNSQTEVILVRHPVNPNIMFGSSNAITNSFSYISEGVYATTNGGTSWFGWDTVLAPSLLDHRGDPGPILDKNGRFIITHLTSNTVFGGVTGIGANYSTNNGASFNTTYQIVNDYYADKNLGGTDDVPSSPYYGNSYVAWTSFSDNNGRFSRTTNGGGTWSTQLTLNSSPVNHFAQGHDVKTGPNGEVYVVWTSGSTTYPYTEDFVGFAKSTNGGLNFTTTENAYDVNGSRSFNFNGWGIRTNGFPRMDVDKSGSPRNGWIYVVTDEINLAPAGTDADVVLHRSTDGGATWSAGVRVNQDPLNNGKVQWFPVVKVDQNGGVNVLYYDNRNFPPTDSCSVFVSRSTDGGNTWVDFEVADHHFRPKSLTSGYMGDYIGMTSANNKLWPIWMDDITGTFQAWTASVEMLPDLWSKDRPYDTGIEPNPDGGPMWISEDIWVRNQPDGFTHPHQHQNPVYRDSILYPYSPNYVYVEVRNRGGAAGSGQLKAYWAKASTGLNWPTQWNNYYYMGVLCGNQIHGASPIIYSLAAGDSIIYEIPWFPPNPSSYSFFGADSSHFCLLSRIETTPSYPFGMTYPEVSSINTNVRNNNNIVWKNVTVIKLNGGIAPATNKGWVTVRNTEAETMLMKLFFSDPKDEVPFQKYGKIRLDLGERLYQKWLDGGAQGDGIERDGNLILVVKEQADIRGMKLDPEETYTINFSFELAEEPAVSQFNFDVSEYLTTDEVNYTGIVGGERFILDLPSKTTRETEQVDKVEMSAYPNPFNPVTTISYSVPNRERVVLKVYDILGREVATLVDKMQEKGRYEVKFNGTNLSSGVYFYRMYVGANSITKRIVLVR